MHALRRPQTGRGEPSGTRGKNIALKHISPVSLPLARLVMPSLSPAIGEPRTTTRKSQSDNRGTKRKLQTKTTRPNKQATNFEQNSNPEVNRGRKILKQPQSDNERKTWKGLIGGSKKGRKGHIIHARARTHAHHQEVAAIADFATARVLVLLCQTSREDSRKQVRGVLTCCWICGVCHSHCALQKTERQTVRRCSDGLRTLKLTQTSWATMCPFRHMFSNTPLRSGCCSQWNTTQ